MRVGAEQTLRKRSKKESFPTLFDRVNIELLCLLKTGPSYPRKLAKLVGARESHVSERLGRLRSAGLVFDRWERIHTSDGFKNVKQYYFDAHNVVLEFNPGGVEIKIGMRDKKNVDLTLPYYRSEIPRSTRFVGRTRELGMLKNLDGTIVVWGMPGMGKTTLVSQFARSILAEVSVFWHQVSQVDSFQYFITKLAVYLNILGDRELLDLIDQGVRDERILVDSAVKKLSASRTLIVLDDFHRCRDIGIAHLVDSIAEKGAPRCIVISRSRIPLSHAKMMKVEGLTDDEARQLIDLGGPETEFMLDFIKKSSGHPLLLKLVSELKNVDVNDFKNTVNDFIKDTIFSNLEEEQLSILLSTSIFRARISRSAIDSVVVGAGKGAILNFLMSMEKIGILKFIGEEFELHPLVREAAYTLLASKQELHRRAGGYYLAKADTQNKIEALYHFILGEETNAAIEVLKKQAFYVDEGYGNVLLSMLQELSPFKDERLASWALLAQANIIRSLQGDLKAAEENYDRALKCARGVHDGAAEASALSGLGIISKELGRLSRAHEFYDEAIKTRGLDVQSKARIMYNAAEAYLEDGRLDDACELMQRSMKIDEKFHDLRGFYVSKLNIDYIKFLKGDYQAALSDLNEARKELSRIGLKSLRGYCDLHIAYVLEAMGRFEDALEHLDLAIEGYRSSGFTFMLAYSYAERAILYSRMDLAERAASDVGEAISLSANVQDRDVLGTVELARAIIHTAKHDFTESERSFERAKELLSQDRVSDARVSAWLGAMRALQGRKSSARQALNQSWDALVGMKCDRLAERIESCLHNLDRAEWKDFCEFLI
ncbi:MAG: tetratricopeptide repeat protein [Nitrososphaerota archaeon]|jgi:ATP/maltotriose-dependent transcriptional regulator MalT|nr:tetratricopeptide repeat protein [Nitrososphaerota archaeon]